MLDTSCVLVKLSVSQFNPRRTDKRITTDVLRQNHANADAGKFVKNLIPETAVKPISKTVNEARAYHYEQSLPWRDEGKRILPMTNYDKYMSVMRQYRELFEKQVGHFVNEYPNHIESARVALNGMFLESDYPDPSRIASRYSWDIEVLPVPSSGDFRVDLPAEEANEIRSKVEKAQQEAAEEARLELYKRLAEKLSNISTSLGQEDKVFRDSLIGNLKSLVNIIPNLNVTGDQQLEDLRKQAEEAISGVSPDTLRVNKTARKETADKAQEIVNKMLGTMGPGILA